MNECPKCESTNVSVADVKHTFLYGAGGRPVYLSAMIPVLTCHGCGFTRLDYRAEEIKAEAVRAHLKKGVGHAKSARVG